ncbi:MAG: hypothetical protein HY067_14125 [Betaproteobacteria bacterium]|nr:hypothetical protein [Betaproteobacteria bacterium]
MPWIVSYHPDGAAHCLIPVLIKMGVLAAWLQLGEYPTPMEATGMSLIRIALAMLAWSPLGSDPASTA